MSKYNTVKLQKNNGKEKKKTKNYKREKVSTTEWQLDTQKTSSETVLARKRVRFSEWTNNL